MSLPFDLRGPARLVMVGVARGLPDLAIGLLEQLLGMLGVTVQVPAIGALCGNKITVCLMGELFSLREVGVATPHVPVVVVVAILRKGEAASDTGKGDKGHPGELTWVHAIASVGHKVPEADEMRYGFAG